jgi:hypothetical protein
VHPYNVAGLNASSQSMSILTYKGIAYQTKRTAYTHQETRKSLSVHSTVADARYTAQIILLRHGTVLRGSRLQHEGDDLWQARRSGIPHPICDAHHRAGPGGNGTGGAPLCHLPHLSAVYTREGERGERERERKRERERGRESKRETEDEEKYEDFGYVPLRVKAWFKGNTLETIAIP